MWLNHTVSLGWNLFSLSACLHWHCWDNTGVTKLAQVPEVALVLEWLLSPSQGVLAQDRLVLTSAVVILDILEYQLTCNQLKYTQAIPRNLSRARMHSKFIKRLQQTVYSHPMTPHHTISKTAYVQRDLFGSCYSLHWQIHIYFKFKSQNKLQLVEKNWDQAWAGKC